MSIGLYDCDSALYAPVCFNLELMKLATYYKKKHEIVLLTPDFTPDRHKQYFYRKDYDDGNFPPIADNTVYGGLAFTDGKYIPMDEAIEASPPDTSIYNRVYEAYWRGILKSQKPFFNQFIEAEHVRLSLDGSTIFNKYEKQLLHPKRAKILMLHDSDLGQIDGAYDVVRDMLKDMKQGKMCTKIGTKFPIITNSPEELLKWISLPTNPNFFNLEHHGMLNYDEFRIFLEQNKQRNVYRQMDYIVTSGKSQNDFIKTEFSKLLRQVIISRSYHIFFSLKYEENYFFDKRWENVIELLNLYQHSLQGYNEYYTKVFTNDTMFNFVDHLIEPRYRTLPINKQDAREIFAFVRENNIELFNEFYELNFAKLEAEGI